VVCRRVGVAVARKEAMHIRIKRVIILDTIYYNVKKKLNKLRRRG
jgi:hypothetical protein